MIKHITQIILAPKGEPIFSESAYKIEICDEASGQFVQVSSELGSSESGTIAINVEDWQELKECINDMMNQARLFNESQK
jgi:lysyl-tRNA synthetase class II